MESWHAAKLVAVVEVEHILNVLTNDGVEREVGGVRGRLRTERGVERAKRAVGQGEVGGPDDAATGFEK